MKKKHVEYLFSISKSRYVSTGRYIFIGSVLRFFFPVQVDISYRVFKCLHCFNFTLKTMKQEDTIEGFFLVSD